jgi:hypothetical protein
MSKMKDLGSGNRASDEPEGKDQSNKACIENKRGGASCGGDDVNHRPVGNPKRKV